MSAFSIHLPATSANLGPGFDTLAVALDRHLEVSAETGTEFSIEATGRHPEVCGSLGRNLLLDVYRKTLAANGKEVQPLALRVHNEIPLGMGMGSSAAVRLAGVALAAHFGQLGWDSDRILAEGVRLEGHPDNAAACWLGGFVAGSWTADHGDGPRLQTVSFRLPEAWRALVVIPTAPLATVASRAVLPESYTRADVVFNLQRASLLTAAFAAGRANLVADAMRDRIHQPYRSQVCPLLPALESLAGTPGVLGVALSGAGPAILLILESESAFESVEAEIRRRTQSGEVAEILRCSFGAGAGETGAR
ncbi:homoserine kinase [Silvibacterium dinghuense]|uniref:Homoserine kinase n=1 Tax=Silvibacterium dinghuense TaxID=1560006 RepID=A0A4Q1SIE1_9BACT|nr:homoserine kinase [Silvibacterium dinghuense]RXS96990.1 homoserine kinase [Silvibacterium dinghuense]GGG95287.1 homoserine kinase [Silvibacterium dinghuense]